MTFGPDNIVALNSGAGLVVRRPAVIVGNRVHDNAGAAILVSAGGGGSVLRQNTICANGGGGDATAADVVIVFNLIAGQTTFGLSSTGGSVDFRNNVVTGNGTFGINGADADFAFLDFNAFFLNAAGDCRACATLGSVALTTDPSFVDAAGFDFRPSPGSPLIDAGVDLSWDVNGPGAGLFFGAAPDIGAVEVGR